MNSATMSALVVRLGVGLVIILGIFLAFRFFDPKAPAGLLNIAISAAAIVILLAPTKWFTR